PFLPLTVPSHPNTAAPAPATQPASQHPEPELADCHPQTPAPSCALRLPGHMPMAMPRLAPLLTELAASCWQQFFPVLRRRVPCCESLGIRSESDFTTCYVVT